MKHVKTLILGGGLTGLSLAYHLEQKGERDYLLIEKEPVLGGLCKSYQKQGFTFDCSGHLLHLHTSYGKMLVKKLLKDNLNCLTRKAFIYTGSSRIPFPFQANLWALPAPDRKQCLEGLLQALKSPRQTADNFKDWCLLSFGSGIYEQFMRPYNTKLWGRSPEELTCEWCGPFVPTPSIEEIRQSVQQPLQKSYGYNDHFYYPAKGGAGALITALARFVQNIQLNTPVSRIDLDKKTALLGKEFVSFDTLVNTIALPVFLGLLSNVPELSEKSAALAHTAVTVYHLAIDRILPDFSWIYFPDPEDPFYRVGLQSGFSIHNAPEGTSLLYIELPGEHPVCADEEKRIWKALSQKGIIEKEDHKLFSHWQFLPHAYAVYDKNRTPAVQAVLAGLERRGCICAGRYGKWEYSFMERSLLEGLEIAEKLV